MNSRIYESKKIDMIRATPRTFPDCHLTPLTFARQSFVSAFTAVRQLVSKALFEGLNSRSVPLSYLVSLSN